MRNKPPVQLGFAPRFLKDLKRLRKKYPHIQNDLITLTTQLENGETPGDQVQGVGYPVYKVRLKSSDMTKGKSGGYRVLYYVKTVEFLVLATIYAKTEQVDISADEIKSIITEYQAPPDST